jgi:transposase
MCTPRGRDQPARCGLGQALLSDHRAAGYENLLGWARGFGDLRRAGVECTGSYGKALTRYLRDAGGVGVIEVNKPDRATRRRRGKTDTIDAEAAARAVLSGQATATAKSSDGNVEMLRLFKLAKSSAIKSRTQTRRSASSTASSHAPSTSTPPNCCSRSGSYQTARPSCSSPPATTPTG